MNGGAGVSASAQNVDRPGFDPNWSPIFLSKSLGKHVTSSTDTNNPNSWLDHYMVSEIIESRTSPQTQNWSSHDSTHTKRHRAQSSPIIDREKKLIESIKYLFTTMQISIWIQQTLHWTTIRKFYRFQIKIYLKDIFNETVHWIQINIQLTATCSPAVIDGASVVFSCNRVKSR